MADVQKMVDDMKFAATSGHVGIGGKYAGEIADEFDAALAETGRLTIEVENLQYANDFCGQTIKRLTAEVSGLEKLLKRAFDLCCVAEGDWSPECEASLFEMKGHVDAEEANARLSVEVIDMRDTLRTIKLAAVSLDKAQALAAESLSRVSGRRSLNPCSDCESNYLRFCEYPPALSKPNTDITCRIECADCGFCGPFPPEHDMNQARAIAGWNKTTADSSQNRNRCHRDDCPIPDDDTTCPVCDLYCQRDWSTRDDSRQWTIEKFVDTLSDLYLGGESGWRECGVKKLFEVITADQQEPADSEQEHPND